MIRAIDVVVAVDQKECHGEPVIQGLKDSRIQDSRLRDSRGR